MRTKFRVVNYFLLGASNRRFLRGLKNETVWGENSISKCLERRKTDEQEISKQYEPYDLNFVLKRKVHI